MGASHRVSVLAATKKIFGPGRELIINRKKK